MIRCVTMQGLRLVRKKSKMKGIKEKGDIITREPRTGALGRVRSISAFNCLQSGSSSFIYESMQAFNYLCVHTTNPTGGSIIGKMKKQSKWQYPTIFLLLKKKKVGLFMNDDYVTTLCATAAQVVMNGNR